MSGINWRREDPLHDGPRVPPGVPDAGKNSHQHKKQHEKHGVPHIHVVRALLRIDGPHGRPPTVKARHGLYIPARAVPVLRADGRAVVGEGAEEAGGGVAGGGGHFCYWGLVGVFL